MHVDGPITIERIATARQLLDEVGGLDAARNAVRQRNLTALEASKTTVTEVYGIGPLTAAIIVGRVGDVRRFPTAGHFARHNGTAPIEASSGPTKRHRLNPRGDRQLNHAMHMAAVTQVRHDTPGRLYYLRKQAEGKSRNEALRASSAAATLSTDVSSPTRNTERRHRDFTRQHTPWAREDNARTSLTPA